MSERRDRVVYAVVGVTLLALLARVVALGGRPFHWSEARVGYWALRFAETGAYEYRPVAGGPLVYVLARWTFELFGATDATARLPVALVGGLAPLVALLFRGVLDDRETVAFAGLLALDPLLLYYSRFLRGDVLAAVAGLVVVGAAVRYHRTGDSRLLYLGAAALAATAAASGFGFAYPVVWAVALLFAVDEARIRETPERVVDALRSADEWILDRLPVLGRAVAVFLLVWYVLFAPRAPGLAPGLYDPTRVVTVAGAAFEGAIREFWSYRVVYRLQPSTPGRHGLVEYAVGVIETAVATSGVTVAAGFVGFFTERYREDARRLVAFGGYATLFGLLVFALAAPEPHPWVAVHLLPFAALPGAVGVVRVGAALRSRVSPRDHGRVVLATAVVVAGATVGGAPVAGAYAPPEPGSPFAQYAQPTDDPEEILPRIARAIEGNEGVDVLFVAPQFFTRDEYDSPPIAEIDRRNFGNRFPMLWYAERVDAEVDAAFNTSYMPRDSPPVVVTTPRYAGAVGQRLGGGYSRVRLGVGLHSKNVTVFVQNTGE